MDNCYVLQKSLTDEEIISIYTEKIKETTKFDHDIVEDYITITKGYYVYPFIEGKIRNLEYLIIRGRKEQSGVIDTSCSFASKDFAMLELSSQSFQRVEKDLNEFNIFNYTVIEQSDKEFIERLLERTLDTICQRHNLILTNRENEIDISPIKDFEELNKKYFLEEIYCIDYFEKGQRKPFKSIYSCYFNDFYTLDFKKTKEYTDFLKLYKRPIVYMPTYLMDQYYDIAFRIYLETIEELKYIKVTELYTKVRKNVKYKEYSKHENYLEKLIFYFKKRSYLAFYTIKGNSLKEEIFYCYLTLKFDPQSGYRLAQLVKDHILEDNYLSLLNTSSKLGNTLAKKTLYEYYSQPKNFNEYYIKRYS